ncbi:MAG: tetratricopeptide repeat protein [Cyanobacteria bacterium J06632_22]
MRGWNLIVISLCVGCAKTGAVQPLQTVLPEVNAIEPIVLPTAAKAAQTLRGQGLAYRNTGDFDGAISTLRQSLALDPTQLSTYVILGWTLHLHNQRPEAATVLETALALDPNHVPALNALGIVYLVSGELDQAVATHTRAAELKPDNEIAYYNLSLAYERRQDYDQAIAMAARATALEPHNPHPWVALALAHWRNRDTPAAITAYRQAINLDGRYRNAGFLAHLTQAGFSVDQIDRVETLLNNLQL